MFSLPASAAFQCLVLVVSQFVVGRLGRLKELTRWMPARLAYWTTLRFMRAQVWDAQALLDLMVGDLWVKLPPPKDGVLHAIFDATRTEKTGEKQPLAYTTKTGKFDPFIFGHSVLLLVA